MLPKALEGTWVFDAEASHLPSAPIDWVQRIRIDGERLHIQEEITRSSGVNRVEVDAIPNGEFYTVTGSALVDEIAYQVNGSTITGIGRKAGITTLEETVTLSESYRMTIDISVLASGKHIPLGKAHFKKQETAT